MKLKRNGQQEPAYRRGTRQGGAVLVEFALVLPLLLLLLFGMVEFGRAFNYWIDETHLANVAARWAAVDRNPDPGSGSLPNAILSEANTKELREGGTNPVEEPPAEICISFPNGGSKEVGDPVKVTVSYGFNWMPFIGEAIGGVTKTTLTGSATMRIEREPSEYGAECSS